MLMFRVWGNDQPRDSGQDERHKAKKVFQEKGMDVNIKCGL